VKAIRNNPGMRSGEPMEEGVITLETLERWCKKD
jgi:hypothetical protein